MLSAFALITFQVQALSGSGARHCILALQDWQSRILPWVRPLAVGTGRQNEPNLQNLEDFSGIQYVTRIK